MLNFKPILFEDLELIKPFFEIKQYRTCDFTIGGIFMWVEYFHYEYCINKGILFLKGDDLAGIANKCYALPLGGGSVAENVSALISEQADDNDKILHSDTAGKNERILVLNTIPFAALEEIQANFNCKIDEMEDWFDYLYSITDLATFVGKRYNKKRNRVNQFKIRFSNYTYEKIDKNNLKDVLYFIDKFVSNAEGSGELEIYENKKVREVLVDYTKFDFVGGILKVDNEIVAMTVAEIAHDTAFIHIEKADIEFEGAYQFICQLFAQTLLADYPHLKYINREEDVGDLGLRKSKQSYYPIEILKKYRMEIKYEI